MTAGELAASRETAAAEFSDIARSQILARLWGAAARESLPGVVGRRLEREDLVVTLTSGSDLRGSVDAAALYAQPSPNFGISLGDSVVDDPTALARLLGGTSAATDRFAGEVANSVTNLALAWESAARDDRPIRDDADWEQLVVQGHPYHPCCRTRTGMSETEVLAYAPEHRPIIDVDLVAVPRAQWYGSGRWPSRLTTPDEFLLPMHPWQRDHVLPRFPGLVPTGQTIEAKPLLSLRTVAPLGNWAGYHIKTSLDIQMTSALRTVTPRAVDNGPRLSALVTTMLDALGHSLGFRVLRDLAGGAARIDGTPRPSLGVLLRESPQAYLRPGEQAVPIAALCARPELAGADPAAWLSRIAELLLPPTLALLAAGVALEAHGQNTLVVLAGGDPVRILYRDFGGMWISPRTVERAGFTPPPVGDDVVSDDSTTLRNTLLSAPVWGSLGELVAALSGRYGIEPEKLWRPIAVVAGHIGPHGDCLLAESVPIKATTAMRLAERSLDNLWVNLPNPLVKFA
ncbi:siderophore synthetase component [Nocardia sp. GAS34]|uniref:IucA/IucC family protein n=1 Tax=unclassified Nocardia TaxID=2637762 RepID=UPI003D231C1D